MIFVPDSNIIYYNSSVFKKPDIHGGKTLPLKKTLFDAYERNLYYLRLSVTDRCQFSCSYCRGKGGIFLPEKNLLTGDEISRLVRIFEKMGTRKIRMTGGEPLVRKDSVSIIEKIHDLGLRTGLTTNGLRLKEILPKVRGKLDSVNVSLDTINPGTFERISGMPGKFLGVVTDSITATKKEGFPIKLNSVVIRENENEITDLLDYAASLSIPIRFIEYMAMESGGRSVPISKVKEKIKNERGLSREEGTFGDGPASYFRTADGAVVGFISYTEPHFCDTCNRLRITSDGKLRLCLILGIELDLKGMLANGADDEEVIGRVTEFVKRKPLNHGENLILKKNMNSIGG